MWRDGRSRLLGIVVLALFIASIAGGTVHMARVQAQHLEAQRIERAISLDKGDMNPHAAAHYGAFVFKPIEPLSAIDPGLDPFLGVSIFLEAHRQELSRHRPVEDRTSLRRLGELSPAFSLQVLVPLLVVALAFAGIAGERANGTLRILLGLGTSRGSLVIGKALGVLIPLAVVVIPASLLGIAAMVVIASAGVDGDLLVRALGMGLAYSVYLGIWVGIGLLVSARAAAPPAAFAMLIGLWFAHCLAAPPLASSAAKAWHPGPTALEFTAAIEDDKATWPTWDERVETATIRFLTGEDTPLASNPEIVALLESEDDETALYERHFANLFDVHERQSGTYQQLGIVSPMLAIQSLSMSLAATDFDHYRRFLDAANAYRTRFLEILSSELLDYDRYDTFDYTRGRELWERIPEFGFETPGALWALRHQGWSTASLLGWLALVWLGVWRSVVKAPVD